MNPATTNWASRAAAWIFTGAVAVTGINLAQAQSLEQPQPAISSLADFNGTMINGSMIKGASQFESEYKKYLRYPAIAGPIIYQDQVADDQEEGYTLTSEIQLLGELQRTIWDYTEADTALQISQKTLDQLKQKGFDILYQCSGKDCGDTAGWSLFLSSRIDGNDLNQNYLLARGPIDRGQDWFVAVYTNDIGGIPRSVVDVIKGHPVAETTQVADVVSQAENASVEVTGQTSIPLVFFKFNSDQLTIASDQAIRQIAEYLVKNPQAQIQIVGHTDDTGEEAHNNQLSEKRAQAVHLRLVNHYGVNPERLKLHAAGEFGPIAANNRTDRRKINRRVEIQPIQVMVKEGQPETDEKVTAAQSE